MREFLQTWIDAFHEHRLLTYATAMAMRAFIGFIYAFVISRPELPARRALRLIATLPLFSPPFALGFSYILMFGRFGLISHDVLGFETSILGWKSLWAVQTLTHFPYAALAIERALSATPAPLEAAARNLGSGGFTVFRTITLPLVRPAVAGAALVIAIYVLADFANPLVIGGDFPLVATEAWPELEPALLVETTITLPVQVNGKKRADVTVARDAKNAEIEAAVLALEAIQRALDGKPPKKVIVVPQRIVNVVA